MKSNSPDRGRPGRPGRLIASSVCTGMMNRRERAASNFYGWLVEARPFYQINDQYGRFRPYRVSLHVSVEIAPNTLRISGQIAKTIPWAGVCVRPNAFLLRSSLQTVSSMQYRPNRFLWWGKLENFRFFCPELHRPVILVIQALGRPISSNFGCIATQLSDQQPLHFLLSSLQAIQSLLWTYYIRIVVMEAKVLA